MTVGPLGAFRRIVSQGISLKVYCRDLLHGPGVELLISELVPHIVVYILSIGYLEVVVLKLFVSDRLPDTCSVNLNIELSNFFAGDILLELPILASSAETSHRSGYGPGFR